MGEEEFFWGRKYTDNHRSTVTKKENKKITVTIAPSVAEHRKASYSKQYFL